MDLHQLEARPGMRSSRCPIGRVLGRNWFKCYRYFSVEEAAYFSQSASPRASPLPRARILHMVAYRDLMWRRSMACRGIRKNENPARARLPGPSTRFTRRVGALTMRDARAVSKKDEGVVDLCADYALDN